MNLGFTAGDVVVVTGAGQGIGRAIAVEAAGLGLSVALWGRTAAVLAWLCSLLAAYSRSAEMLIAARALLGVAGATLAPSTLSLIRNMFADPRQRTLAVGVWISSFSAGAASPPLRPLRNARDPARRVPGGWYAPLKPRVLPVETSALVAGALLPNPMYWLRAAEGRVRRVSRNARADTEVLMA